MKKTDASINYILQLFLGPAAFLLVRLLPLNGLDATAQICMGIYAWMMVWWAFKPIPWIATTLLPLILFPLLGISTLAETTSTMFGQRIFFLLLFIFMLGNAVIRVGIGHRLAVTMLSIQWINGKIDRFIFIFMITAAILQAIFGVVGIIITMSVGKAVIDFIFAECDRLEIAVDKKKTGSHIILAGAYGQMAGCMVTIQANPQNILTISLYEELLHGTVTYMQWFIPGLVFAIVTVPVVYLILKLLFKSSLKEIPNANAYFSAEKEKLGKVGVSERRLWILVIFIVFLWIFTTFVKIPGADYFLVAILGLVLLYIVPEAPKSPKAFLGIEDAKKVNWDNIFLVTGAIGYSGILTKMGVIGWVAENIQGLHWSVLFIIAVIATALKTNFLAGMATATAMATLLLPLSLSTPIHPLVFVKCIATMSVGLMVPWAGTAAAITFGSQHLDMKEMIRVGILMVFVIGALLIGLNLIAMQIPALYPPLR